MLDRIAPPEAQRCPECGAPLAARVRPDGIVTVGGLSVTLRRTTDFLVCESCLATLRVEDLRAGYPLPI